MCDTLVLRKDRISWFAKNSDREPDEPQYVEFHPGVKEAYARGTVALTYMDIPQVAQRHATLISRPSWMWGAEMGVNECGVVIGNEALFSRLVDRNSKALLGMDIVRLALERASSAIMAVEIMTDLLETYGQGGPAGFCDKAMCYDNGFLIADADRAFVLETAGRHWAQKEISRHWTISNCYSLRDDFDRSSNDFSGDDFGACFDTKLKPWIGRAEQRAAASCALLDGESDEAITLSALAGIMRHHAKGDGFSGGSNADLCMHARGPLRPSHTTGSMIVKLEPGAAPTVAFTGSKSPCISLFKPTGFSREKRPYLVEQTGLWQDGHRLYQWAKKDKAMRDRMRQQIAKAEPKILALLEKGELGEADHLARMCWQDMQGSLMAA